MSDRDHPLLPRLAEALRHTASGAVVLTGAGVSQASGVPTFRSTGGIWERYDPAEYATIDALIAHPEKVWRFLRDLASVLETAEPNDAHDAIADLGALGLVRAVVTQNIDGLHQRAGSKNVIELHGSSSTLSCMSCGRSFTPESLGEQATRPVPRCPSCDGVVKPDVVLFGEQLPADAVSRAQHEIASTDLLLVVGTSMEVDPAASLPALARQEGAAVWEINPAPELRDADGVIAGPAEVVLPRLADLVVQKSGVVQTLRSLWRSLRP